LLVVFGLGNPGDRYSHTRHNLGKDVVSALARKLGLRVAAGSGEFFHCEDPQRDLCLVIPATYVNTSGVSACQALEAFGAVPGDLLAVCDDFSLPLGTIRIRKSGSDGGHNGLASIIYQLGTQDFPRLRLGVGPLPPGVDAADFVLSRFERDDEDLVEKVKETACEAVLAVGEDGIDRAMNTYNMRMEE
jgi:PTH1 family peptidyl-tRNA hydrolase